MQISILEDAGPTARVALAGKLDMLGVRVTEAPLATLAGSKSNLLIDMSAVTFIASPGIRQLVSTSKTLTSRGGRLVLLNPTAHVADVLVVTGVDKVLSIVHADPPIDGG